jgi:hypothetical protein
MVLMVVRQEAGVEWLPVGKRCSKRELGNNTRQPGDLTKNRQSDSLRQESTYSFSGDGEEGRC